MKDTQLLDRVENAWNSLDDFRQTRRRNINYIYGDQWGDLVRDDDGKLVTERERIYKKTGGVPLQNNHLIKIVHALTGIIAKSNTMPVCYARQPDAQEKSDMMTNALQANWELNSMKEMMVGQMEELLQGGMAVVCEEWNTHDGEKDAFTFVVNPDYFFFESKMSDPRLWDIALIGEIRDYKADELEAMLRSYGITRERLRDIYQSWQQTDIDNAMDTHEHLHFYLPPSQSLCRTYHVWTSNQRLRYRCIDRTDHSQPVFKIEKDQLDYIKEENKRRRRHNEKHREDPLPEIVFEPIYDQVWRFTMLAPDGTVLVQHDSPFKHGDHPYSMTAYHFVNGRIYPFMSTVIDQQRYINRLITLNDMYINSSVKGLKMIPKRCIPRDMSLREFARQAVEVGGWVVYEPDPTGAKPEIITQAAMNLGVAEMLNLQIASVNEITSVNGALQGIPPRGNTGYARYAMEMENSNTSVASLTKKFLDFQQRVAKKKMKVIHQFYQEERNVAEGRFEEYGKLTTYQPKQVRDIDFKVSIQDNADTPVARMMNNDLIIQMWDKNAITTEQMLQSIYLPGLNLQTNKEP